MKCRHQILSKSSICPICHSKTNYEIDRQMYQGEPIIEILYGGESWFSRWDYHFRFGRIKAAMILYSINTIKSFLYSENPGELILEPRIDQPDPDMIIQSQIFIKFKNSNQEIINEPYLKLERLTAYKYTTHISFGRAKSLALVQLEEEIREWLRSVHGWYR